LVVKNQSQITDTFFEHEDVFRGMFEEAGIGMGISTIDGQFLLVNRALCQMLDYSEKELLAQSVYDITWKEDRSLTRDARERIVNDGRKMDTIEKRFVRRDGVVIWGLLNRTLVRDEQGNPHYFVSQIQDISEKKAHEEELRQSQEQLELAQTRLQDAINSLPIGFNYYDADERLVSFNQNVITRLDQAMELAPGKRAEEIIRDAAYSGIVLEAIGREDEWIEQRLKRFREKGNAFEYETTDGRSILIRNAATSEGGTVAIRIDISEQKQAEREIRLLNESLEQKVSEATTELQASEKRYRLVLENLADAAIVIDTIGMIQYVNPEAENIFGYSTDEMIGNNINMLMPEPVSSAHDGYLARYLNTGKSKIIGVGRAVDGKRKNGTTFPLDLNISETTIDGVTSYFGTIRDMTDRVKAEREIVEARLDAETSNRVKTEFLANMSHELRTPLNAILGFSEALSGNIFGPLGNEKQHEYLDNIHKSGQHLLDLINDVLDVSVIEAGKLELNVTEVDIGDTITASLLLVKSRAEQGGVEFINADDGLRLVLRADERRMRQVFVNLLSNAVKFTEPGGTVDVSVQCKKDGSAVIEIKDSGVGMTNKDIRRAMDLFGQVQRDDKKNYEGTGLGLPLTKRLVEAQGGNLLVESEPEIGTTVIVEFPRDKIVAQN